MKLSKLLVFLFIVLLLSFTNGGDDGLIQIPARVIDPIQLIGDTNGQEQRQMNAFEISQFVTYKEYKVYLEMIKKDSSNTFYCSQLPDSTMCAPDAYKKYVNSTEYDNYPVMGVSWEAAMNYCRWMTLRENKDSITVIYRLPLCTEWLDANDYFKGKGIVDDLNKNYSDWLLNSKDESAYFFGKQINLYDSEDTFTYFAKSSDAEVLKRKVVMGNSYFMTLNRLRDYYRFSYYSFKGYRQIGFRYVKCKMDNSSLTNKLLQYWGINRKLK